MGIFGTETPAQSYTPCFDVVSILRQGFFFWETPGQRKVDFDKLGSDVRRLVRRLHLFPAVQTCDQSRPIGPTRPGRSRTRFVTSLAASTWPRRTAETAETVTAGAVSW